jgi:hypothetical protein
MRIGAMLAVVTLAIANAAARADDVRLVDVTERTGIDFRHRLGSAEKDWIAEVNGGGVALLDYDADGDLDIYLVNGGIWAPDAGERKPRNALFRNEGSWRFTDVTKSAGVGDDGWGSGVAVADVDNDGDLDLYVTNRGPNVLYLNQGDGAFVMARDCGAEDPRWSTAASFADFNGDGLVDLYVANYIEFERDSSKRRGISSCSYKGQPIFCGPGGLDPSPDSLFLNLGKGKFRDVSREWGVRTPKASYGLGTLVVDVDRDGFPDVVVANDTRPNSCFLNQRGRRFLEGGLFLGIAYNDYGVAQAGMGLASADLRGVGRDDLFVTNFEDDTNTLYRAEGEQLFVESTYAAGLGASSYRFLGWGTFFFDADGDTDLDLFVANGHVAPQVDKVRGSVGYRQRNQLFLAGEKGRFVESLASMPGESESPRCSRGAAFGDLDGDGDPDVVVSNIDDRPTILENLVRGRWVEVRLRGVRSNRAAIGARVVLTVQGRRQERTIQSGMSWASQCELSARFGLGGATATDALRVIWPGGQVESFPAPRAGQVVTLVEGSGESR